MSASPSNSQDPTQFLHWSVEDVLGWLSCLPLSQDYSTLFQEYRVDGHTLFKMGPSYLDQLQISNETDRHTILQSISVLRIKLLPQTAPTFKITESQMHSSTSPLPNESPFTSTNAYRHISPDTDVAEKQRMTRKQKSKSVDEILHEPSSSVEDHTPKCHTPTPHYHISSHMLDILRDENTSLKKELDMYYERVCRLQKLEQELEHLREAHRLLEATTARKERLEVAMRKKLEEELRKSKEASVQQKVELHSIRRNASFKVAKPDNLMKRELARRDTMIAKLVKQNQNVTTAREQLEKDLHCMKSAMKVISRGSSNDDDNEGEENNKATMTSYSKMASTYSASLEKLQSILSSMLSSSQKRQHLELQLRKQLEAYVQELKEGKEQDDSKKGNLSKDDELKIATLQADLAKFEHKCLELIAERQFILDAAVIPRETKIDQLERQLKEKEKEVQKLKDQKMLYMEQLEEAQKDIANFENRVSSLEATLKEKDTLIETLQSLLEPEESEDMPSINGIPAQSETPTASLIEAIGRQKSLENIPTNYKMVMPVRRTSSPSKPVYSQLDIQGESHLTNDNVAYDRGLSSQLLNRLHPTTVALTPALPTYDQHMQVSRINNGLMNGHTPRSQLGARLGIPSLSQTHVHNHMDVSSHSFPNTPEVQRRRANYHHGYVSHPVVSAPGSQQCSPLPIHRKTSYPIVKSLTPPPDRIMSYVCNHPVQPPTHSGTHNVRPYISLSDARSLDSDDSLDSLLSPSSPPSQVSNLVSSNGVTTHKHSSSLPSSARRQLDVPHYGEGQSQDSGVLVEGGGPFHSHSSYDRNAHTPLNL